MTEFNAGDLVYVVCAANDGEILFQGLTRLTAITGDDHEFIDDRGCPRYVDPKVFKNDYICHAYAPLLCSLFGDAFES